MKTKVAHKNPQVRRKAAPEGSHRPLEATPIAVPLGIDKEAEIFNSFSEILSTLERAEDSLQRLEETCGFAFVHSGHGLEAAGKILAALPESEEGILEKILTPCQAPTTREELAQFANNVETYHAFREKLTSVSIHPDTLLGPEIDGDIADALKCIGRWRLEDHEVEDLLHTWKIASETAKLLENANSSFSMLLGILDCDLKPTHSAITYVLGLPSSLRATAWNCQRPAFLRYCVRRAFRVALLSTLLSSCSTLLFSGGADPRACERGS